MRVVQAGNGACFPFETIGEPAGADLNGYGAVKTRFSRFLDLAHSAGAQLVYDLIRSQSGVRG